MSNMSVMTVYDADKDVMVEVSDEQRSIAAMTHQQVLLGAFMSAMALQKMVQEKLYIGLGCQSQEEYISTMLPYSRRQAFRLLKIADRVGNVYKSLSGNGLGTPLLSENSNSAINGTFEENPVVSPEDVQQMGFIKLLELTQFDDSDLKELLKNGKVSFENGESLDWEELKSMTAKDMQVQIAKATGKYKDEIKRVKSRVAVLEEENKLLLKEKQIAADRLNHAKEIESQFGAVASKTADKREQLHRAADTLSEFQEVICRSGVIEDDPETLRKELVLLVQRISEVHATVSDYYGSVILATED